MLTEERVLNSQQLCKDLEYLCSQDDTILDDIIDEYVYLLNDKRIGEMQEYVRKELESDDIHTNLTKIRETN